LSIMIEQYKGFFEDLTDNFSLPLLMLGVITLFVVFRFWMVVSICGVLVGHLIIFGMSTQIGLAVLVVGILAVFCFFEFKEKEYNFISFTALCFVLMGLMLVILLNPKLDEQSSFINRVFYSLAHGAYSIWIGLGAIFLISWIQKTVLRMEFFAIPFICVLCACFSCYLSLYAPQHTNSTFGELTFWFSLASIYLLALYLCEREFHHKLAVQLLLFALPVIPLRMNWADSEMRGHDFGWRYGHDMLKDLDRDAVVYGGTDPGRFVPTYMIFVESFQPKRWREDPDFDRRDLYIITQNALADQTYMNYIRDHYDVTRPKMDQWYHHLFGRDKTYPVEPLRLPTREEFETVFEQVIEANKDSPWIKMDRDSQGNVRQASVQGVEGVFAINAAIAQWIFEQNKGRHTFYVEESYPLQWMYPYLEPCGLIMKLNKEPKDHMDPKVVIRDRILWDKLVADLLSNPRFCRDDVARKTYSKLRSSLGGLYANRNMPVESERAYLQSLDFYPASAEARSRLLELYTAENRFNEAIRLCEEWRNLDPQNPSILDSLGRVKHLQTQATKEMEMSQLFESNKSDPNFVFEYLNVLRERSRWRVIDQVMNSFLEQKDLDLTWWQSAIQFYASANKPEQVESLLTRLTKRDPKNPNFWYNLAVVQAVQSETTQACTSLKLAFKLNSNMLDNARSDIRLNPIRNSELFQNLTK
jgi:tetratricopeptide (TPR) repeat protein